MVENSIPHRTSNETPFEHIRFSFAYEVDQLR